MSENISKKKRDDLLKKIMQIRNFIAAAPQDENTVNLLTYLSDIEKDVNGKKYGLVFEEHREEIDEILDTHVPVLNEDKSLFINSGGNSNVNFLIEGDNLAALTLLEKTHKGKIDVIYIDPPYNTGAKDFIYDDNFVDGTDSFRHSKWCSFIQKRLEMAKILLAETGVIFISINNFEFGSLKLLCDEFLGEYNFLGNIVWESTTQPINAGIAKYQLQQKTESIFCYAKNKNKKARFLLRENETKLEYPHQGKFGKCRFEIIEKSDAGAYKRDSMKFEILGKKPRYGKRWQIGEETARKLEKSGKVEIVDGIVKKAVYPEDEKDKISYIPFWSLQSAKFVGTAEEGKRELNLIMGKSVGFDTVKPINLIKELISHISIKKESSDINCGQSIAYPLTVLDFFAGSGTTGHAVMKLNAEDDGARKFILCTNNENNICRDVTYERIKRVIDKENYSASLKYFKVDYVPISDKLYYEYADELLKHIRELVELENGINFVGNEKIAIVLTEEEMNAFIENIPNECVAVYVSHDILLGAYQEKILEEKGIKVNVIPDYYFRELMR